MFRIRNGYPEGAFNDECNMCSTGRLLIIARRALCVKLLEGSNISVTKIISSSCSIFIQTGYKRYTVSNETRLKSISFSKGKSINIYTSAIEIKILTDDYANHLILNVYITLPLFTFLPGYVQFLISIPTR